MDTWLENISRSHREAVADKGPSPNLRRASYGRHGVQDVGVHTRLLALDPEAGAGLDVDGWR